MSISESVTSVPTVCFSYDPSKVHPDDLTETDKEDERFRLVVVRLDEPGYRLAFTLDLPGRNAGAEEDFYFTTAEVDELNRQYFKVEPDWGHYIAGSSFRAQNIDESQRRYAKAASDLYRALEDVVDNDCIDIDKEDDVRYLLQQHEDYSPENQREVLKEEDED